jgi:hypothetical protein
VSQALVYFGWYALGLSVTVALGLGRRAGLAAALAFPLGMALWVTLALAALASGARYDAWLAAALVAAPMGAALIVARARGTLAQVDLVRLGTCTVGAVAAALAVSVLNVAIYSYDSQQLMMFAKVLGLQGEMEPKLWTALSLWGPFQIVAHSPTELIGVEYMYGLGPMTGLALLALFSLILWSILERSGATNPPRRTALWCGLVVLALSSPYMMSYHFGYIHTNMPTALYLLGFVGLFWLAEFERHPGLVAAAFVCLIAVALMRLEAPLTALLFIALTVFRSNLPRRWLTTGMVGYTAVVGAWLWRLATQLPEQSRFLSQSKAHLMLAATIAFFGVWLVLDARPLRRLRPRIPQLAAALCIGALVITFALQSEHMAISTRAVTTHLFRSPYWGLTWYGAGALWLLALLAPPQPYRTACSYGVPLYIGLIILLGFTREPYRVSIGDSAARMMVHIEPLVFLFLGASLIPRRPPPPESPATPVQS